MILSDLAGQNTQADPAEALRPLVAELRALVDRLELKDDDASLARALHAAHEQVAGPHAVVMLLGERDATKHRFLERLLGVIPELPRPTAVCTRLEYGAPAECTVTMPLGLTTAMPLAELASFRGDRTMLSIRLPNPALKGGLALIDTPAAEQGEPDAHALGCSEEVDAWIFVLDADHALSEQGEAWLRALPEGGERLELVVENAQSLDSAERMAARERLMETLHEHCGIHAPRLTLVAAEGAENGDEHYWHGRFATFHSVMMQRGREHRLQQTQAAVGKALEKVETAIDAELKSIPPGPRQARLRLGKKELAALQARLQEPETQRRAAPQSSLGGIWAGASEAGKTSRPESHSSPLTLLAEAMAAAMAPESAEAAEIARMTTPALAQPEEAATSVIAGKSAEATAFVEESQRAAEPLTRPALTTSFSTLAAQGRPRRGLSVHFSAGLRRLLRDRRFAWWRRAIGFAIAVALLCLILWALSPRGFFFTREAPLSWEYHPPQPAAAEHVAGQLPDDTDPPDPDAAAALPDTRTEELPRLHTAPLEKPSAAIRMPLPHPIPSGAQAGVAPRTRRHHRHLLGLDKLWHWIRRSPPKPADD